MAKRDDATVHRLELALRAGLGEVEVRSALGLADDAEDASVARSVVQLLSATSVAGVQLGRRSREAESAPSAAESSQDSSLLGQLDAEGSGAIAIDEVADVRTLECVLLGGKLRQRRRALERLASRLEEHAVSNDEVKSIVATLETVRDVELDYELARVREHLSGAPGRKARSERVQWERAVADLKKKILEFWDVASPVEPVASLAGDRRALILLRTRDLPDLIARHLSAVLEGEDGASNRGARRALLSSLRYAGDPRLAPSLISLLDSGSSEIQVEATRALRRIDDPRVRPALVRAYERSVVDVQRARLAGALGAHGDHRGADYVRSLLTRDDAQLVRAALAALDTLGGAEDTDTVLPFLEHRDVEVVTAAVRTLAHVGDGRALPLLAELGQTSKTSALRAVIEDASIGIRARMELRGEEPTQITLTHRAIEPEERPRTSAGKRWAAWRHYLFGRLWIAFGMLERGIRRLEVATKLRPSWVLPLVAKGTVHARKKRYAKALAAFRQAVEADRAHVERTPHVARALAESFLRRAEEVERDGRYDIAQGLLREALAMDLRRAPSAIRFELERRLDSLRRSRA